MLTNGVTNHEFLLLFVSDACTYLMKTGSSIAVSEMMVYCGKSKLILAARLSQIPTFHNVWTFCDALRAWQYECDRKGIVPYFV